MHIGGLLGRQQAGVRVMHLADVLASTEAVIDEAGRSAAGSAAADTAATTGPPGTSRTGASTGAAR